MVTITEYIALLCDISVRRRGMESHMLLIGIMIVHYLKSETGWSLTLHRCFQVTIVPIVCLNCIMKLKMGQSSHFEYEHLSLIYDSF